MRTFIFREQTTFRSEVLATYMSECNRYKVMDNDQIVNALAKGDVESVVNANLKLVISIAKAYQGMGLTLEDLIQEGNIGLLEACSRYDVSRGTLFTTCALEWVRKAITDALTEKGRMVRLPKNLVVAKVTTTAVSGDAPISSDEDGEKSLFDFISTDSKADSFADVESTKAKVAALLNGLTPREKEIVCKLFGIGCREYTQYEVSVQFNMTEERIRQIKVASLERMAAMMK